MTNQIRVHFVNGDYLTGWVDGGRDAASYVEGVLGMNAPLRLRTALGNWVVIPVAAIVYVQEWHDAYADRAADDGFDRPMEERGQ